MELSYKLEEVGKLEPLLPWPSIQDPLGFKNRVAPDSRNERMGAYQISPVGPAQWFSRLSSSGGYCLCRSSIILVAPATELKTLCGLPPHTDG